MVWKIWRPESSQYVLIVGDLHDERESSAHQIDQRIPPMNTADDIGKKQQPQVMLGIVHDLVSTYIFQFLFCQAPDIGQDQYWFLQPGNSRRDIKRQYGNFK